MAMKEGLSIYFSCCSCVSKRRATAPGKYKIEPSSQCNSSNKSYMNRMQSGRLDEGGEYCNVAMI